MNKNYFSTIKYLGFIFSLLLFCSCSFTKKTKYFQDIPDTGRLRVIAKAEYIEPKIQVDDILTILVQTVDPQASSLINAGNVNSGTNLSAALPSLMPNSSTGSSISNLNTALGYLVNKDGNVTIPILGKINVVGLTTDEARQVIFDAADRFYKEPSVVVRNANFKVNVAGEVLKPGTYIMPNEKVSVLDALTMAGDLTVYGKRDNVLLIRQNPDGSRTPYRINLKKSDFMSSPYFYLKQNDYIYVEPDEGKAASTDYARARNYTLIGSFISVLIILFTYTKK